MSGRKTWMRGEGFRVYAHKASTLSFDGDDHYAYYDETTGNVHVGSNAADIMGRKAFHELGHKAFHGISYNDAVAIFGEDDVDLKEEALMCFLETKFYDLLVRNGWLKFAKPPKFDPK